MISEKYITELQDVINDLVLMGSFYVEGYPFDEDHKAKHRKLLEYARKVAMLPSIEDLEKWVTEGKEWKPVCSKCFKGIKNDR